jgi:hypothetical protein
LIRFLQCVLAGIVLLIAGEMAVGGLLSLPVVNTATITTNSPAPVPYTVDFEMDLEFTNDVPLFYVEVDCGDGTAVKRSPLTTGNASSATETAYDFLGQCPITAETTQMATVRFKNALGRVFFAAEVTLEGQASAGTTLSSPSVTASGLEPLDPTIAATAVGDPGAVQWQISCNGDDGVYEVTSSDTDNSLSSQECAALEAGTHTICFRANIGGEISPKSCHTVEVTPQVITIGAVFGCSPTSGAAPLANVTCLVTWTDTAGAVDVRFKKTAASACPGAECFEFLGETDTSAVMSPSVFPNYASSASAVIEISDPEGFADAVSTAIPISVTVATTVHTFDFVPAASSCQLDSQTGECCIEMTPLCGGNAVGVLSPAPVLEGGDTNHQGDLGSIPPSDLGANLEQWAYWEGGQPYCDRMKQASLDPSTPGGWSLENGASITVNENGWPLTLTDTNGGTPASIYTLINRNVGRVNAPDVSDVGHYPTGLYSYTCTGTGTFETAFDGDEVVKTCPGSGTFNVATATESGGIMVRIKSITSGPLVITVNDPTDCTGNWRTAWLDSLGNLSWLRFMDWMRTNWNPPAVWSERLTPGYRTWAFTETGTGGVPVEVMVDAANTADKNMWITIPDSADDTYVQEMAEYICANLEPELRVGAERGNELWNFGNPFFNATNRCAAAGAAAPYSFADNHCHRWKIARSMQDWEIFENTPGCSDARVVNILGLQNADPAKSGATFMDWDPPTAGVPAGAASDWIEVVAVAPYWNLNKGLGDDQLHSLLPSSPDSDPPYAGIANADCTAPGQGPGYAVDCCTGAGTGTCPNTNIRDWTPEQWQESMLADIPEVLELTADHFANVDPYGIELWAYEGGNHVTNSSSDTTLIQSMWDAQEDAGMAGVVEEMINGFRALGGQVFVYFQLLARCGGSNCWGAAEYVDELDVPKYEALMGLAEGTAADECAVVAPGQPYRACWTTPGTKTVGDTDASVRGGVVDSSTGTASVEVLAAAPVPAIALSSLAQMTFNSAPDAAPPAQTRSLTNPGGGTASWTVSESLSWLTVAPTSGTTAAEADQLTFTVSPSGLAPGSTQSGQVCVQNTGDAANRPCFTVEYQVQAPAGTPGVGQGCSGQYTTGCLVSSLTYASPAANGNQIVINFGERDGSNLYVAYTNAAGDYHVVGKGNPKAVVVQSATPDAHNNPVGAGNCAGWSNGQQVDFANRTGTSNNSSQRLNTHYIMNGGAPISLPVTIDVTDGPRSFVKAFSRVPQKADCTPNGDAYVIAFSAMFTAERSLADIDTDGDGSTADQWSPSYSGSGSTKIRVGAIDAGFTSRLAAFGSVPASSLTTDSTFTIANAFRYANCATHGIQPFVGINGFHQSNLSCYDATSNTYGVVRSRAFFESFYRLLVSDCVGNATCDLALKKWIQQGIHAGAAVAVGDWRETQNYNCNGIPNCLNNGAMGGWFGIGEQKLMAWLAAYATGNQRLRETVAGCAGSGVDFATTGCTRVPSQNAWQVEDASYMSQTGIPIWGFPSSYVGTETSNACRQLRGGSPNNVCSSGLVNDCGCRSHGSYTSNHVDALRFLQEFVTRVGGATGERIWNHREQLIIGWAWDRPVGVTYYGRGRLNHCPVSPTTLHGCKGSSTGTCLTDPVHAGAAGGYQIGPHATEHLSVQRAQPVTP